MSPDDWITVTGAVSASLVILGVAQWTEDSKKEQDAEFHKEIFLERDRLRQIFYEKNKENFESKEERDARINAETNIICDSWFGKRYRDDSSDGVPRRQSGTKLVQKSETVFKLEEDIQEFQACCSCPDCGLIAFHFLDSSEQNSKILRECISCEKVWLQLK